MERRRLGRLPEPCPLVTGKTVYDKKSDKFRSENYAWYRYLTKPTDEKFDGEYKRVGQDPKKISANILSASGHKPRSATSRIKTYLISMDLPRDPEQDKGLKGVRALCLRCAVTVNEVRSCAIINCPLWAHRLGTNPHNYHKRQARKD
jgi:hypothetical protein